MKRLMVISFAAAALAASAGEWAKPAPIPREKGLYQIGRAHV